MGRYAPTPTPSQSQAAVDKEAKELDDRKLELISIVHVIFPEFRPPGQLVAWKLVAGKLVSETNIAQPQPCPSHNHNPAYVVFLQRSSHWF